MHVALATAAAAGRDLDEPLLVEALRRAAYPEVVAWHDAAVDWGRYDRVVLRSTWDYADRRAEFLAWTESVARRTRLLNPPEIVRANTDKHYLAGLDWVGVPTVPTEFAAPGEPLELPREGSFVVKPAVSNGSRDTMRCAQSDRDVAAALAAKLHGQDRTVMVQPFIDSVDERGETAMVHLGGRWSHAIGKDPILSEGTEPSDGLFAEETLTPRTPSDAEVAVASAALDALDASDLVYARVDLVAGEDGAPLALEVELTEPSLFLREAPGAADRLARAILTS